MYSAASSGVKVALSLKSTGRCSGVSVPPSQIPCRSECGVRPRCAPIGTAAARHETATTQAKRDRRDCMCPV